MFTNYTHTLTVSLFEAQKHMSLSPSLYFFTHTPNLTGQTHIIHMYFLFHSNTTHSPHAVNTHTRTLTHIHIYKSATSHTYTHTFLKFYTY